MLNRQEGKIFCSLCALIPLSNKAGIAQPLEKQWTNFSNPDQAKTNLPLVQFYIPVLKLLSFTAQGLKST